MDVWSVEDKRFLRSLRIVHKDPPAPMRFRVEPTADIEGAYRVIDTERPRIVDGRKEFPSIYEVGPKEFTDPRAAAEQLAAERNAQHIAKQ